MPETSIRWHDIWTGALITAALFAAASSPSGCTSARARWLRDLARRVHLRFCSRGSTTQRRSSFSEPSWPGRGRTGSDPDRAPPRPPERSLTVGHPVRAETVSW